MPKQLTVFYSWQSDTPSEFNRVFIEKAIQEALNRLNSDAKLEEALRGSTVELDRDTKGVAGSPPITDTILKKIEGCAVFIADLTFVGKSLDGLTNAAGEPRLFPNPNVLIEYGYSLRSHSHSRIIGVMNTEYGKPDKESLPFDLRHMLWPIQYCLGGSSEATYEIQFEMLVQELVDKIGLILSKHSPAITSDEKFRSQPSNNPAIFFDRAEDLITDRPAGIVIPEGGKAYLRVYPISAVSPIKSELEAKRMAVNGNLQPMGEVRQYGIDRNAFGAIAIEAAVNGKVYHFTQLFLSREIWGVDAMCVNAERLLHRIQNQSVPYIVNAYVEKQFIMVLHNYLIFAQTHLKLPLPLRVEAGLVGIKDYPISIDAFNVVGKSLHDTVKWEAELSAYGRPAWEVLSPFFDLIWDNCGIERTAQHQAASTRRFTN